MANEKISALDPAAALAGTEVVAGVQAGGNVKITVQSIADLGAGASSLSELSDVDLTGLVDGNTLVYEASSGKFYAVMPSAAETFTGLSDVPDSYSGQATKIVAVNPGETGLEFLDFTTGGYETLDVDYTDGGNTTTTETDIFTYTTAANELSVNGDRIEAQWAGTAVGHATATRQFKAYFGGTAFFDSTALAITSNASWVVWVVLTRVSATVVRYALELTLQNAPLAAYTVSGEITGLTLSNTNIFKLTGTAAGVGAATNDIVGKTAYVEKRPITAAGSGSSATADTIIPLLGQICALIPRVNSATFDNVGFNPTSAGIVGKALATTTYLTSVRRVAVESSSTANTGRYLYGSNNIVHIGSAAGRGGFEFRGTMGIETKVATGTMFLGLAPGAIWAGTDVVSNKTNIVGIGAEDGDTNWQLFHNDGSGTATKTDLGASFPFSNDTDMQLELSCDPAGASISYTITRLDTGSATTGTISTNLPDASTFITPMIWLSNRATASNFQVSTHGLVVYDKRGQS